MTTGKKPARSAPARAPAATRPAVAALRDGFSMTDEEIELSLRNDENGGVLEDYFGAPAYEELRQLARQARPARGGDRVLIVPGIMGSTLGYRRKLLPPDFIWLDPIDIVAGRLSELTVTPGGAGKRAIEPLGVILLTYLTLKYRLKLARYDAEFWPFDWRMSLPDLGRALARTIDQPGPKVQVVAHSMGGLVARAALKYAGDNLRRIVMLGTPNFGSYAPVQAFRGTGSTVTKLAWLDRHHDAAGLADIFGTFPGLIEMIPTPGPSSCDLFDPANWPDTGKRPSTNALTAASAVRTSLPLSKPGVDIVMIAGMGQETVVDARLAADPGEPSELAYTLSTEGDGTVPLRCALLPTADQTYYVAGEHGALPGNGEIQGALPSILATGRTVTLKTTPTSIRGIAPTREVREHDLAVPEASRGLGLPGARDRRRLLDEFAAPAESAVPAPLLVAGPAPVAASERFADQVIVGRGRQRRLELTIARGSIVDADAGLYVLGLFKNVDPGGAARAVDEVLDGAIAKMVSRRMFGANVGEVSILPAGRHPMRAGGVAFVGLGPFDEFGLNPDILQVIGENLIRTAVAARVDDFAMVPIGGASGELTLTAIRALVAGVLQGLKDADTDQNFRGITICELDPQRCELIRDELFRLSATTLFDGVEVVFRERALPSRQVVRAGADAARAEVSKVYLIVREEAERDGHGGLSSSVLTSGAKAAIINGSMPFDPDGKDALGGHLDALDAAIRRSDPALKEFGRTLGELALSENVRQALATIGAQHLVVVHDAAASRIPWETLYLGDVAPALTGGISHRYEAADLSVAKWLQRKQEGAQLSVLLVVNPTGDLKAAADEGARIREALARLGSAARLRVLEGAQARKSELMACFSSGEYDILHYAGHAFFDPIQRTRSGLLCAEREVLSGADLAGIGNLPPLMFFNACEAARVRGEPVVDDAEVTRSEKISRNIGFAEALLRGGIANFIGTYWSVGDDGARTFAVAFYGKLLDGATLNEALLEGRRKLLEEPTPDWADYVFYGDPDFRLKMKAAATSSA